MILEVVLFLKVNSICVPSAGFDGEMKEIGQFYSHEYVNTWQTWTHGKQPNSF